MAPALIAEDAAKRYGSVHALDGISLEVQPGELVGLLGPNGAGKSTLVKVACGLIRASRGRTEICGAPAGSPAARAALGYLAELLRFPGWYSAEEVLQLHQRLVRSPGGESERRELLDLVGLAYAVRVDAMSKGMQQRLGIAQVLVGSPRRAAVSQASRSNSGRFGESKAGGANLPLWTAAYFTAALGLTLAAFARRDL
jgi:ABC-type multidrug transport system ATPase subunit